MLKRHATPADGESSRDMTSARGLRATAEYVHRISTAKLLACKHEGRKGPKAEEEIAEPPRKAARVADDDADSMADFIDDEGVPRGRQSIYSPRKICGAQYS